MSTPLVRTIEETAPAAAATATAQTVLGAAPWPASVTAVTYTPAGAITGAASPASRTFTLYNRGQAGTGVTVVATLAMTAGVNAALYDERTIPLSGVAGATAVVEGDVLGWESFAVGATGLADPGGLVRVTMSRTPAT